MYSHFRDNTLAGFLEGYFATPVIDQTGLHDQLDIDLKWDEADWQHHNPESLKQSLLEQLGLELAPTNLPLEMLEVDEAK